MPILGVFVQCCDFCVVFLSAPATATIICIQSRKSFQQERKLPPSLCLSFCNLVLVIFREILTFGKQTSKVLKIMHVAKRFKK